MSCNHANQAAIGKKEKWEIARDVEFVVQGWWKSVSGAGNEKRFSDHIESAQALLDRDELENPERRLPNSMSSSEILIQKRRNRPKKSHT